MKQFGILSHFAAYAIMECGKVLVTDKLMPC